MTWDGKCHSDPDDLAQFLPSMLVDANSWQSVERGHYQEQALVAEQENAMNEITIKHACGHSASLMLTAAPTAFTSAMKINKEQGRDCPACRKSEWHAEAEKIIASLDIDLPTFSFVEWGKPWKASPKQTSAANSFVKFFVMSIKDIVEQSDVAKKAVRNFLQSEGPQSYTSFWFDLNETKMHQKELGALIEFGGLTKAEKEALTGVFAAAGK